MDETIFPVDHERAGQIVDDEMHAIMVRPLPPGVRLTALFDSCHSGTALDLPYVYDTNGQLVQASLVDDMVETALTGLGRGGILGALVSGIQRASIGDSARQKTLATKTSAADVIMFSGCKDSQTSADTSIQGLGSTGAMSYSFIAAMTENPHCTYIQLLNRMRQILRGKFSQKPQLSSGHPMNLNTIFIM